MFYNFLKYQVSLPPKYANVWGENSKPRVFIKLTSYDHHLLTELASHLFPLSISRSFQRWVSYVPSQVLFFTNRTNPNTTSLGRHEKLTERREWKTTTTTSQAQDWKPSWWSIRTNQAEVIYLGFVLFEGVGGFSAHSHHEAYMRKGMPFYPQIVQRVGGDNLQPLV